MYNEKIVRVDLEVLDKLCQYLNCGVGDILEYQDDGKRREDG